LSDNATDSLMADIGGIAAATQAAGLEFWIGESNSVACGGQPNISDVFASALWAVGWLHAGAMANVSGINFHGGEGTYG
jgi:hypothetical protein